jgi:hypothetical protein
LRKDDSNGQLKRHHPLTDQGIALLENRINHRLKAKDVLTVAQKKELLHLLFIAAGF